MELKRKVNNLFFATGCLVLFSALAVFAGVRQAQRPVSSVIVTIGNEFNNYFISEQEVTALLTRNGNQRLEGARPEDLNLKGLEALGPGLLLEWGEGGLDFRTEDGKAGKSFGPYATVWRREPDGAWKIVRNLSF